MVDTDDDLPLNRALKFLTLKIIVRSDFQQDFQFLSTNLFR